MAPESRRELAGMVACFAHAPDEEFVGYLARLRQAIHSFDNLDVNPAILRNIVQLILSYDFLRDELEWHVHVLGARERQPQVEVGSIVMYLAPGEDSTEFQSTLIVGMSAVGALVSYGKLILSPPTVRRVLSFSILSGL